MTDAKTRLALQHQQLLSWLHDHAYPLWSTRGIDARNGGFVELLDRHGVDLNKPRRARVQPRQIYCFAMAAQLGWSGDATGIVERSMDYFITRYRRDDGLFRTLCDTDGNALDHCAFLYDQSFALLAFATAAQVLNARDKFESQALMLREVMQQRLRTEERGFISCDARGNPGNHTRESNPHMHLLEACLAWCAVGKDAGWQLLAEEITELAMNKFIQPNGALKEFFTDEWQPASGTAGRIVEPGHQFEWAWLLLRCSGENVARRTAALKLIEIGEAHGVRNGVAINALLDDFSIHDANARCWCQTERIKAAVLAAQITGNPQHWSMAVDAVDGLLRYLDTPVKGLWLDIQQPDGTLIDAPSPASSFYHIIAAIAQVDESVKMLL